MGGQTNKGIFGWVAVFAAGFVIGYGLMSMAVEVPAPQPPEATEATEVTPAPAPAVAAAAPAPAAPAPATRPLRKRRLPRAAGGDRGAHAGPGRTRAGPRARASEADDLVGQGRGNTCRSTRDPDRWYSIVARP